MKAALYYGPDDIRLEDVAVPEIGAGEVLIKIKACGLCGTDLHKILQKTVPAGTVLGHEIAGEIVKTGGGVKNFSEGDRVVVAHHVPCFVCSLCRKGHHSLCPEFKKLNIDPGGFCEYVRILPASVQNAMFKIPDGLSFEVASLCEPLACCLRAVRKKIQAHDVVTVIGAGPIGIMHVQLAKALGAGKVFSADVSQWRRESALKFGADLVFDPRDEKGAAKIEKSDIVIIAAGNPAACLTGFQLVKPGGTIILFAENPPGTTLPFDPNQFYHKELTILGAYSSSPVELKLAFEMLVSGKVQLSNLVTHKFPLNRIPEAVNTMRLAQDSLKIVIIPDK